MRFTFTSTRMAGIKRVRARGSKDEDQSGPHTMCTDLLGARAAVENSADALEVLQLLKMLGFPGCSDSKQSACNAGDPGSTPGSGRFFTISEMLRVIT